MLREKVICSPRRLTQTFPTAQSVEDLLGPEQAAGTITSRDLDLAKRYIHRNNRYSYLYDIAVPASILTWYYGKYYRRPSWPTNRITSRVLIGGLATLALVLTVQSVDNTLFLLRLNNSWGFAQAVTRIRTYPNSVYPVESSSENNDTYQVENRRSHSAEYNGQPARQSASPQNSNAPPSRWAEIRKAHLSDTAQATSWEKIRRSSQPSGQRQKSND